MVELLARVLPPARGVEPVIAAEVIGHTLMGCCPRQGGGRGRDGGGFMCYGDASHYFSPKVAKARIVGPHVVAWSGSHHRLDAVCWCDPRWDENELQWVHRTLGLDPRGEIRA